MVFSWNSPLLAREPTLTFESLSLLGICCGARPATLLVFPPLLPPLLPASPSVTGSKECPFFSRGRALPYRKGTGAVGLCDTVTSKSILPKIPDWVPEQRPIDSHIVIFSMCFLGYSLVLGSGKVLLAETLSFISFIFNESICCCPWSIQILGDIT